MLVSIPTCTCTQRISDKAALLDRGSDTVGRVTGESDTAHDKPALVRRCGTVWVTSGARTCRQRCLAGRSLLISQDQRLSPAAGIGSPGAPSHVPTTAGQPQTGGHPSRHRLSDRLSYSGEVSARASTVTVARGRGACLSVPRAPCPVAVATPRGPAAGRCTARGGSNSVSAGRRRRAALSRRVAS